MLLQMFNLWSRWTLTLLTFAVLVANAGSAIAEYMAAEPKTSGLLWKMAFLILAALAALGQTLLTNKSIKNYGAGLQEGHLQMQSGWKEASRRFESAENSLLETIGASDDVRLTRATMGMDRLLSTFASTVDALFAEVPKNSLTMSLGIPSRDGKCITIAELLHESDGRRRGGKYDVPDNLSECYAMLLSFRINKPIYTPDTSAVPDLAHKRYKSILNVPISDPGGQVIAIMNVDSTIVRAFGSDDPNNPALASLNTLTLPVQRAVAALLLSTDVYGEYRC